MQMHTTTESEASSRVFVTVSSNSDILISQKICNILRTTSSIFVTVYNLTTLTYNNFNKLSRDMSASPKLQESLRVHTRQTTIHFKQFKQLPKSF